MFKTPRNLLFIIIIVSAGLRLFHLDFADGKPVFDEQGHYLRAARTYLTGEDDTVPQHPPLGKELLAVGILLLGDNPYGWRLPSLVFSLVGIGLVYLLAREMFPTIHHPLSTALLSALLLSVDSMYFIYSRLAVLDMFLTVFVLLTMFFLWRTYRDGGATNLTLLAVSFGLAFSTKWTALHLVPVMVVFLFLRYRWKKLLGVVGVMGVVGGAVYVATYAPYLTRHSFRELVGLQRSIVMVWKNFDQDRVFTPETYFMRHVHSWIVNPVSAYFAEPTTDGKLRIVIGLYNPVVLWGGLGWLVWRAWKRRKKHVTLERSDRVSDWSSTRDSIASLQNDSLPVLFLLLPILSNYIPWFFVRRVQYPYYFLPSLPLLVIFIASVLDRARHTSRDRVAIFLLSSIIMFGYLFPFLTSVPANLALLNPLASGPIRVRLFYDETPERVIFSP